MHCRIQQAEKEASIIEVFTYAATVQPPLPSWEIWNNPERRDETGLTDQACWEGEIASARVREPEECDAKWTEEIRRGFEAGREQGLREGREAERAEQAAAARDHDRSRMANAAQFLESFQAERTRYFESVEGEVVKLALAVAARVLRREAQVDPLLLTGAVRVAMGQLPASTQVRLRVPVAELELWTETMAHLPNLRQHPEVVAGEGMRLGDCTLETALGSVDLGVRSQLGEIEHRLFDQKRPDPNRRSETPCEPEAQND